MDDILVNISNPATPITPQYRETMFRRVSYVLLTHTHSNTSEYIESVRQAAAASRIFTAKQKRTILKMKAPESSDDENRAYYSDEIDEF